MPRNYRLKKEYLTEDDIRSCAKKVQDNYKRDREKLQKAIDRCERILDNIDEEQDLQNYMELQKLQISLSAESRNCDARLFKIIELSQKNLAGKKISGPATGFDHNLSDLLEDLSKD